MTSLLENLLDDAATGLGGGESAQRSKRPSLVAKAVDGLLVDLKLPVDCHVALDNDGNPIVVTTEGRKDGGLLRQTLQKATDSLVTDLTIPVGLTQARGEDGRVVLVSTRPKDNGLDQPGILETSIRSLVSDLLVPVGFQRVMGEDGGVVLVPTTARGQGPRGILGLAAEAVRVNQTPIVAGDVASAVVGLLRDLREPIIETRELTEEEIMAAHEKTMRRVETLNKVKQGIGKIAKTGAEKVGEQLGKAGRKVGEVGGRVAHAAGNSFANWISERQARRRDKEGVTFIDPGKE